MRFERFIIIEHLNIWTFRNNKSLFLLMAYKRKKELVQLPSLLRSLASVTHTPPTSTGCPWGAATRASGSGGGPKPIHSVILLEVPSVTAPVFHPVLGVTLEVPFPLLFILLLSHLFLLFDLAVLANLGWGPTISLWDRLSNRPWLGIGLSYLEHRLCLNLGYGLSEKFWNIGYISK